MNILGVKCYGTIPRQTLLIDSVPVCTVEEERFARRTHPGPENAIRCYLEMGTLA